MAVNIANGLSKNNIASYLITTRYVGSLIHDLNPVVVNKCLNRRGRWNPLPILGLIKFISSEKITVIHAHTTSVFIASVMVLVFPKIKLVWHDHYGELERIEQRPIQALKRIIHRFSGIISVNESLRAWAQNDLGHGNIIYLPNFIEMGVSNSELNQAEFNQAELNEMESEVTALKDTNPVNMDVPKRNQI